jgi:Zn finger protein HypA/HybF involved in hydrogenase expression
MTPAPLEIQPTRWTFSCRDCSRVVESDSEYLRNLELCGACLAEREAEQLADLRDDEREEEQP